MYRPNLSVVCFFICLSYFIFDCALLLFCAQAWHGNTLSSRNDPIFFCSLHWRNLSLYNKITITHFKQISFWWKNVIKFRGKVYSNFFKFVQQLSFLSVCPKCCFFCSNSIIKSLFLRLDQPVRMRSPERIRALTVSIATGTSNGSWRWLYWLVIGSFIQKVGHIKSCIFPHSKLYKWDFLSDNIKTDI